ncbi:MAG: nucleotidyltransferase family protein [Oscillospiraceae bacterium]|nr:nucleotidyltransferase family protein [Oscillospiraceae bacterium]
MNIIYQGLLTLVKSALTGQKLALPEGFALEKADGLIRSQSLIPLIYPGAINCGISPKSELMQKYQVLYFQHLVISERQMQAVKQLCDAFEENGIDYMLLKGCNMKRLYPKPEMRGMGDADVLIRMDQYDKIKPVMQALQYKNTKESIYDYVWQTPSLYLELHKRLYAPTQTLLCDYFGVGWEKAQVEEGHRYGMSKEVEYAYIFSHMAKHFRICGIGVRHFIDLYVFRNAYPVLDEKRIERIMKKLHMLDFYRNVSRTLEVWFDGRQSDEVTQMITDYTFNSGSFGTMENKLYYQELTKASQKKSVKNTKFHSLMDALFPPLRLMQASYYVLIKFPILLPLFWPVRWVDVLIHRRQNISRKLRLVGQMSDEKLLHRERAMKMMGMNFDCGDDDD